MNWLKFLVVLAAAGGLAAGDVAAKSFTAASKNLAVKHAAGKVTVVKPVRTHFRHHHFRHHRHVHVFPSVFFGWHYWPAPYYRETVVVPAEPIVYIERGDAAAPAGRPVGYWYYCQEPEGYYPYVTACPGGWRQEEPRRPPE